MIRKVCADGKKRIETNGSSYFHNSYFIVDMTSSGVPDEKISASISELMSQDAGVPVDVVFFVEVDDPDNKYKEPNDLVKMQESNPPQLPAGLHRFVICDQALFIEELMDNGR